MSNRELKAHLRRDRLGLRDSLAIDRRIEASLHIADHAAAGIEVLPGEIVSGFYPLGSEVDVRPLMALLKDKGARLALPVVLDRQTIVFRELLPGAELTDTGFGTRGPGPEAPVVDPDTMLVPLSAFDHRGHRIGYGAGHYDRAIARLIEKDSAPRLIGIAFDCQEVPEVPFEPHDVGLHAIVTESGMRTIAAGQE
ncbi:5-formyltetrahydrofolate cyclo-ligase [Rhizobium halophytocola]|uniref:5-formyltetrahydrofolate cyclo-ligase n=1 Tax=Rhizobium halophytocola TaxID=735519 RepID=A0ABS4DT51_9HYPH|nr:5-formyltetrahydrofolate cyclo-ligase [Rhizobium halophytocola]MBP1848868.1 5-formyltetrahydrofolate cyclo-ligase [Rhizobium halophytocola]